MKSKSFSHQQFTQIFANLQQKFLVFGPKRLPGKGNHIDSDLVTYAQLNSADEIELAAKSDMSPKSLVFPPDETLFYFNGHSYTEPELDEEQQIIVLLRPCDINGFDRLDKMFLENAEVVDPYYARRRQRLHFFMIECRQSFENCFCVSMNANKSSNYEVALGFEDNEVKVKIANEQFASFFENTGSDCDFEPEFVEQNQIQVRLPQVDKMPAEMYSDEMWREYDSRCIACGRCNISCVTCSCFTTRDLFYGDSRNCGERRRVWDACHLDGFTDMAGGHTFRKNKGDRMRFKTFHKVYDFAKRFDAHMCVGCGRCDDQCPEYISFSTCINRLSDRLDGDKS